MTEREKIIEVIKQASEQAYADFHELFREGVKRVRDGEISRFTNRDVRPTHDEILADKLIEAGFGNVADWKHRTDVAEKALLFLCGKTMSDVSVMIFPSTKTQVRNNQELYDYCIKQAEKEVAEEEDDRKRKND